MNLVIVVVVGTVLLMTEVIVVNSVVLHNEVTVTVVNSGFGVTVIGPSDPWILTKSIDKNNIKII